MIWKAWLACPICKRLAPGRALCSACAEQLYLRREPQWREGEGFAVSSLFSWQRDGWFGLRWWSAALKGKEDPRFWREPALWALDEFARPAAGAIFVPVPSTRGPNHALGFARALAAHSGLRFEARLRAPSGGAQKRLSRDQRQARAFQATEGLCSESTPVIIVDDIVTTGATAQAAYRALGRPRSCQVWCLLDRGLSPLAGS